ncbi:MAG TPA: DMT family transporter, partial [Chroococcales cyanobacterium]
TVSIISVCVYFAFCREAIVPVATLSSVPWWAWTGGLCGTVLLLASLLAAPKLGAGSLVACIVAGQVICSILLDHFGFVGYAVHQLNWTRALGAVLLVGGMLLIVKS